MTTVLQVCNDALLELGQSSITSLEDASENARLTKKTWRRVYPKVLREYPWNFAIKRVFLEASDNNPVFGYSNAFPLPKDYIKLIELSDSVDYRIEGNLILADVNSIKMRYVSDVDNPNLWDETFVDAVTLKMAATMCISVTAEPSLERQLLSKYEDTLLSAKRADALENPPVKINKTYVCPYISGRR